MQSQEIVEGARTVAHMASYLDELKRGALSMSDAFGAVGRGYFTPTEDEQVRRLQISYWQSRNALFELIHSFRHDEELPEDLYAEAFLVAFGGAVLLVDAARFLRETFHDKTLVRRKLDQPDPQFGIAAGMYETVQKSLTSPRHAYHLVRAVDYLDLHQELLRSMGARPHLVPVWEVIDRLGHRVRASVTTYVNARLRVRIRRVSERIGYGMIGRAVYGLQKLVSSMMSDRFVRPGHRPAVPVDIYQQLIDHLHPGGVIVVRKQYAVTNYFLPGYWPHAALYLGNANDLRDLGVDHHENIRSRWDQLDERAGHDPRRVLEAMKDGVRIRSIGSPMASDSVVILRPTIGRADVARALARGLGHEGKPYDFDFDFNRSDRLVCTEVVYRAYEGIGGIQFQLTRRAGRNTLAAGDLIRMAVARNGFEPVVVYSPAHERNVVAGSAAEQILIDAEGTPSTGT